MVFGMRMSLHRRLISLGLRSAVLLASVLISQAYGIITSDEADTHRVTPGVSMYDLNLDGVGMVGFLPDDGQLNAIHEFLGVCTCSLITDRHVLTAGHCFDVDGTGETIEDVFLNPEYPSMVAFELPDSVVSLTVADIRVVDEDYRNSFADLAIVTLSNEAPEELPRYPLYGKRDEVGQAFVRVGYGVPGHGAVPMTRLDLFVAFDDMAKRAGWNRFEAAAEEIDNSQRLLDPFWPERVPAGNQLVSDFDSSLPEHNALVELGIESDLGFGQDEVCAAFGDSGGPVFLGSAIAGVTSCGAGGLSSPQDVDFPETMWGALGLDTRVSTFTDFILEATDQEAQFVLADPGDFNSDGDLSVEDVDLLIAQIISGGSESLFDLNQDSVLDRHDLDVWITSIKSSWFGDANLDGQFSSSDLVQVFTAGKYETNNRASWSEGDWNGDGVFGSSDIVKAIVDGGYEKGPRTDAMAVPEPGGWLLLILGTAALLTVQCVLPASV